MRIRIFCSALLALLMTVAGSTAVHAQAISGQGTWESTLQARDVGNTGTTNAFYDTSLNVTWLANANMAGKMDWNTAASWASSLAVGDVGGWRLPTITDVGNDGCNHSYAGGTDCGYNVQTATSEMANLWYVTLGNKAYCDPTGSTTDTCVIQPGRGLANTAGFQNMRGGVETMSGDSLYWSSTEYAPDASHAWGFDTNAGGQTTVFKFSGSYGMAVHSGDVGSLVTPVPEPETYAMLLAGLGLIGAIGRRRRLT